MCNMACESLLSKDSGSGPALGMFKCKDTPKPVSTCVLEYTSPKQQIGRKHIAIC